MELDKIITKIMGMYVGYAIVAVIVAIVTLGQPFAVLIGIGTLGLISVLGDAIAQYGVEAVINAVYVERLKKESLESLLKEIDGLPLTSSLKFTIKEHLVTQHHQITNELENSTVTVTENSTEIIPETTPETPQNVVIEN